MSEVNLNLQVDTQPVTLELSTTQLNLSPNPTALNLYSGGPPGATGATGYTGSTGPANGYTGSAGFIGSKGDTGPPGGYTGSQGNQGIPGAPGTPGANGPTGYTGSAGYIGQDGYTGSRGYTGSQGIQGPIGFTGSKGDIGYTGSIGYVGSTGAGYTGSRGAQGTGGTIAYYFKSYSTSTQIVTKSTITNTQYFPFENIIYNNGFTLNNYTTGTNSTYSIVTVNNPGTYRIHSNINTNGFGLWALLINDVPISIQSGDTNITPEIDTIVNLNANDTIKFYTTGTELISGDPTSLPLENSVIQSGGTSWAPYQYVYSTVLDIEQVTYTQQGYTGSIGYTGSTGAGYTGSRGATGIGGAVADVIQVLTTVTQYSYYNTPFFFETTNFSTGGISRSGTDTFVIANTGTYLVTINGLTESTNYATNIGIEKNGTIVEETLRNVSSNLPGVGTNLRQVPLNYNVIIQADANDQLKIRSDNSGLSLYYSLLYQPSSPINLTISQITYTQQGYTGSQGIAGYNGSQGNLGYTGSTGAGYTGSQGIGYTGSQGATGTGGVIANYFKAYSTLTQTIQKTAVPYEEYFPFETQIYNNGFTLNTYVSTGTKQYSLLTVQNTGTYRINATFLNSNASGQKAWALLVNNSAIAYQGAIVVNSSGYSMPIDTIVNLNPNDVISFITTGTNLGTNSLVSLVTNIGVLTNIPALPSFTIDISQVTYTQ